MLATYFRPLLLLRLGEEQERLVLGAFSAGFQSGGRIEKNGSVRGDQAGSQERGRAQEIFFDGFTPDGRGRIEYEGPGGKITQDPDIHVL